MRKCRAFLVLSFSFSVLLTTGKLCAQQVFTITTNATSGAGSLADAISQANAFNVGNPSGTTTITINSGVGPISPAAQMFVNANVSILGNGSVIDMLSADRAFFIAGGNVSISNLTIQNGNATGGAGADGGGGGGGLGGAIFVANGVGIGSSGVVLPSFVTLTNISFLSNSATGGAGSLGDVTGLGGGGGMGGIGAVGHESGLDSSGGGGGGFGYTASGGAGSSDGEPGADGEFLSSTAAAGTGGYGGKPGGIQGGGGGGGNDGFIDPGAGGGGGVGGASANGLAGGAGGFGGGGGGAGGNQDDDAIGGAGGFGGGGGAGTYGGQGGFGGGGGAGSIWDADPETNAAGAGGFAGGYGFDGDFNDDDDFTPSGGGGAGLGGALFVMNGANVVLVQDTSGGSVSFVNNTVAGGQPGSSFAVAGSAYGPNLFAGGNVFLSPAVGQTITLTDLGGAGNLTDPNVAGSANDPNASGNLGVIGGGLVVLAGTNYHSGNITIHNGTMQLGAGVTEQGANIVTVGQNSGDQGTLILSGNSFLSLKGWNSQNPVASTDQPVVIAQDAGSTGRVVIGDGAGSSGAAIAARVFTGGAGNGTLEFTQQYAVNSTTNDLYPFYTTLAGSLNIVQSGIGTTLLNPLYGANTATGDATINSGVLATGGDSAALAGVALIQINSGGTFAPGQSNGINDAAVLDFAGGDFAPTTSISETMSVLNVSGDSRMDLGGGDITLTFSFLTISAPLAIYNYTAGLDEILITSQEAIGSLSQISFFSDNGQTFLGTATFLGDALVPIPEPRSFLLLAVGVVILWFAKRKREAH